MPRMARASARASARRDRQNVVERGAPARGADARREARAPRVGVRGACMRVCVKFARAVGCAYAFGVVRGNDNCFGMFQFISIETSGPACASTLRRRLTSSHL